LSDIESKEEFFSDAETEEPLLSPLPRKTVKKELENSNDEIMNSLGFREKDLDDFYKFSGSADSENSLNQDLDLDLASGLYYDKKERLSDDLKLKQEWNSFFFK